MKTKIMYLLLTLKRFDQDTQKKVILNNNLFLLYFVTLLTKVEPILTSELWIHAIWSSINKVQRHYLSWAVKMVI